MRHVKLILEYDGTAYGGWQRQPGVETVQAVLEEKLEVLLRHPARVSAAGRTDAGVHALGQVVCFHTDAPLAAGASEAPADFDPRRHAKGKRYRYLLWNHPSRPALLRRRTWHVRQPLDLAAMRAGARALVGEHDFSAFRAAGCEARSAVRVLRRLEILPWSHPAAPEAASGGGAGDAPALLAFEVEGTAFLRFMVRNLVGTLVEVGLGRIAAEEVAGILAAGDRRRAGRTAPPQGLVLLGVDY
jgi:tRNA pseudouridine38-40 synthase